MMFYAVDLPGLLRQVLPELQTRLDDRPSPLTAESFRFVLNEQQCVLHVSEAGELSVVHSTTDALALNMPASFFWRLLFGESSWKQVAPSLRAFGLLVPDSASVVLNVLFPQREVIFWGSDKF